jgi:hypothetical protein
VETVVVQPVGVVEGGPIEAAALFVLEGSVSVDGMLAATGTWVTVGGAAAVEGRARVLAVRGA